MEKIYSEVEVTSWDRNEYPGGHPNPTGPSKPGPWYPDEISGHGLYLLTKEDWNEVKAICKERTAAPELLADFFKMEPVMSDMGNFEIRSVAFERLGDYAVVVPTQIDDSFYVASMRREVDSAKRRLVSDKVYNTVKELWKQLNGDMNYQHGLALYRAITTAVKDVPLTTSKERK
jgi:hypothetical protein